MAPLYLPAAHAVQPRVPLVRLLYVPAAHAVQATEDRAPAAALYVPAAHAVQPAGEVPAASAV